MTFCKEPKDILNRIYLLRRALEEHLSSAQIPTDKDVVRISQELDKLIVQYHKIVDKLKE